MKRLTRLEMKSLYVDPELHRELAIEAARQGKTIRELVERYISTGLKKSTVTPKPEKSAYTPNRTY